MKYDFVIVGSGPAGSIISWNLAKKGFKIALIDRASKIGKSDKNSLVKPLKSEMIPEEPITNNITRSVTLRPRVSIKQPHQNLFLKSHK